MPRSPAYRRWQSTTNTVLLLFLAALLGCNGDDGDGDGFTVAQGDCDDHDATVYPGAPETCNGRDDDCNGDSDEGAPADAGSWYADADADGYGNPSVRQDACSAPTNFVADDSDCDDLSATVNPSATEICNGWDDDCDGLTDEDDDSVTDAGTWYEDADGDGYGDPSAASVFCEQPSDYVSDTSDCDDDDAAVNPDASEICNGVDDDCDALVDDEDDSLLDVPTWYLDADGDGHGDANQPIVACEMPSGASETSDDCDDADYDLNPSAAEVFGDGVDNDCDDGTGWGGSHSLSGADVKIIGENSYDNAGTRVAFGGDINGDGRDDLLVSSPEANADSGEQTDNGKAYVLFGPVTTSGDLSSADLIMTGANGLNYAGFGLSSAGDTNGDGYDDLLVGAHAANSRGDDSGTAFLVMGPASGGSMYLDEATTAFLGDSEDDHLGWACGGGGDMNADGYDDLLIGAFDADPSGSSTGAVYVIPGPVASGRIDVADAGYTLEGESGADEAGWSVAMTGDTDGDGCDDFLVGAREDDDAGYNAGAAYFLLGPVEASGDLADSHAKLLGELTGAKAGYWTSAAGDVNADGYADSLVGAPLAEVYPGNQGVSYLLYGPISGGISSLSIAEASFIGEIDGGSSGKYVSSAGDVDGDGGDDILIASMGDDEGADDAGCAYLVFGPSSGIFSLADAHVKLLGEAADDEVSAVARAGDQNLDGFDDLLIGAPYDADGGTDAGALYVVFGDGEI